MSRLNLPARKSFVQELKVATAVLPNDDSIPGLQVWSVRTLGQECRFSIVWIQGLATIVHEFLKGPTGDHFNVMDTTGVAQIIKNNAIPPGCPEVQNGKYVLVIGELMRTGDLPVIKAMKIQDLSQDITARDMWPLEVIDLQLHSPPPTVLPTWL